MSVKVKSTHRILHRDENLQINRLPTRIRFLLCESRRGVYYENRQSIPMNLSKLFPLAGLLSVVLATAAAANPVVEPGKKSLPLPGESLLFDSHEAFLIAPQDAKENVPWVWYAPTLPSLPSKAEKWMFERFLKAGIAIAGIDVGESYGSPAGQEIYTRFHDYLVGARHFSKKPVLLARSRGGLMLYNWAIAHPDEVAAVAGIYPVCDIASYPGIAKAAPSFGMTTEDLTKHLADYNPIDRLKPLAAAKVPLFHLHGDEDHTVPLEANSMELAKRYRELGGPVRLDVMKGHGHDMWEGWFQSENLTDFIIEHAGGSPEVKDGTAAGNPVLEKLKALGVTLNPAEHYIDVASIVCLAAGSLELVACTKDSKEHESIVMVEAKPVFIHTALVLLGAQPGTPAMRRQVSKDPDRWMDIPPSGSSIGVSLVYQEKDGKAAVRPISDFIEASEDESDPVFPGQAQEKEGEKQKFPSTFVFTGSQLMANGDGPKHYLADDSGDVISISTFGDEVLSLPEIVGQDNDSLMWEVDPTHLPPVGTKVMLRLKLLDK